MDKIKNGGPAFPAPYHPQEGIKTVNPTGMTLRDYFAVRAPMEIPGWFKHVPATPRPAVPVPHESLTGSQYNEWEGLDDWLELSDASKEVRKFHAEYRSASDAASLWDREQEIAQYFAWRWHYADMMISTGAAA